MPDFQAELALLYELFDGVLPEEAKQTTIIEIPLTASIMIPLS